MKADIALAASARDWPDRLHRFLLDHGGGRIVGRLMGAEQARDGGFDVLIIDDVCSFLTPRLVTMVKGGGAEVIGVYDPEDGSDAKRRLLECGISDVIESGATPEEMLRKVSQSLAHRVRGAAVAPSRMAETVNIAVTGPSEGVGMTEVAIALAWAISSGASTVLVDLDQIWPSIAQRLDLPVHPNIRTAIDHALHSPDRIRSALHSIGDLSIVGGRADGGHAGAIDRHETIALLEALGPISDVVVADVGPAHDVVGGMLREFDNVIVVGTATPVGIARLMKTGDHLRALRPDKSLLAVVNLTGRSSFQRSESVSELARMLPDLPVVALPFDSRIAEAAWNGTLNCGRGYRVAVQAMADVVNESLA